MCIKILETVAVILALGGTFLLALGLRIRTGIEEKFKKELDLEKKGLISPSEVQQNTAFFIVGLAIIFLAALIQISILWFL